MCVGLVFSEKCAEKRLRLSTTEFLLAPTVVSEESVEPLEERQLLMEPRAPPCQSL